VTGKGGTLQKAARNGGGMPRPYRPIVFANEFINLAHPNGAEHMKLQKLVYYTYGWWIKYHDESIISEAPQVWQFGPVFQSLYHALKHHGRSAITTPQNDVPFGMPPLVDTDDADARQLARFVWSRYGNFSSFELSDRTHSPGSAWRVVAEQHDWRVPQGTPIPADAIRLEIDREAERFGIKWPKVTWVT
jgi:uncharacterized phage-associated protein